MQRSIRGGLIFRTFFAGTSEYSVLDQPEVEPFEEHDAVVQGVLLERPAALVFSFLDCCYGREEIAGCCGAPVDQVRYDLVHPDQGYPTRCLEFGHELVDEVGVVASEEALVRAFRTAVLA